MHHQGWAQEDSAVVERPLWELGIGLGEVWRPDYPGANHSRFWTLPFPWAVYRGEIFRSDKEGGTRARLIRGATYEFNLNAAGGLPASSTDNDARRGLPDLEWLGEAGPRLTLDLYTGSDRTLLRFNLPLRAAFSTDIRRVRDRGWILAPELLYDRPDIFATRMDVYALLTASFTDRRYADYFYSVNPDFATGDRPSYRARAGYMMSELNLGAMYPFWNSKLRVFLYGSLQSLHGAANARSPLLRANWNTSATLVLMWVLGQSEVQVQSNQ